MRSVANGGDVTIARIEGLSLSRGLDSARESNAIVNLAVRGTDRRRSLDARNQSTSLYEHDFSDRIQAALYLDDSFHYSRPRIYSISFTRTSEF